MDKLAEIMPGITPFHYAYNNPIGFNDPTGLSPELPRGGGLSGFDHFKSNDDRMQDFMSTQSGRVSGFLGRGYAREGNPTTRRLIYDENGVSHTVDDSNFASSSPVIYEFLNSAYYDADGNLITTHTEFYSMKVQGDDRTWYWDAFYATKSAFGSVMYGYKPVMMGVKYLYAKSVLGMMNTHLANAKIALENSKWMKPVFQRSYQTTVNAIDKSILNQKESMRYLRNAKLGTRTMFFATVALSALETTDILISSYRNGEVSSNDRWKLAGIAGDLAFGYAAFTVTVATPAAPFIITGAAVWYIGRAVYQNRDTIKGLFFDD